MLDSHGILAAIELAFFAPAIGLSIWIVLRHGHSRKLGWFYLVLLCLLRLIGAICTLVSEASHNYSVGLLTTIAVTNAIGTAPLLLALMGFMERMHDGMERKAIPLIVFRPLHLISLVALVLAIVGGTDESSNKLSTFHTGRKLLVTAAFIFLAIFLSLAAITLYTTTQVRFILPAENTLLRAAVLSLPFLLVRIVYTVALSLGHKGSPIYFLSVNIYIQALMKFLMEAIVVCLYLYGGFATPRVQPTLEGEMREGGVKGVDEVQVHGEQMEMQPESRRREHR